MIVFPMGLWWVVQGWVAVALRCGFFSLGNFGGDRRVWLSFGGWCCVGLPERDKKTKEMEMKEKREKPNF